MKILCIGPQWEGSNARALFIAFTRLGNEIEIIDEFDYIPLRPKSVFTKVLNKVSRTYFIKKFNRQIYKTYKEFNPDTVVVYKGHFVEPYTINQLKKHHKVFCFYPDVSFHTHGKLLPTTLVLYDHVFTTKTFGIKDLKQQLGQENTSFIPHGFDPEIHNATTDENSYEYKCEASFIGTWSPRKEKYLSELVHALPNLDLKIWGSQWNKAKSIPSKFIIGKPVLGNDYRNALQGSTINIALLSEKVTGASNGDQITSRTFHIPACNGFMLHQHSEEIGQYYEIGKEIDTFQNPSELIKKTRYYLEQSELRLAIQAKGYQRAIMDHDILIRAHSVLETITNKLTSTKC